jgi:uncharacterized protein YndB with AHSA1/START domain
MIQKEISVEIARPVHEVFAFVDDASKAPEWLGPCVSLKQISPGPRQVGTQLHYTYRQGGRTGEMEGEVTAHESDRHLAMKFRDKMFEVSLDFSFSASPSGTMLKHVTEIQPQGFAAKLMSGMIASATEKQVKQDMEKLKVLLESSSR